MMALFPDITIAIVVIVIAIVLIVISRMGILPKKTLPFIAAGVAAVFGFTVLQRRRESSLLQDARQREEELKDLEQRIAQTRAQGAADDQQLTATLAALQRQREATQKELLLIRAQNAEQKDAINRMSTDELAHRFDQAFGGQNQ